MAQQKLKILIDNFAHSKGRSKLTVLDDLLSYIIGFFDPMGEKIDGWQYTKEDNAKFHEMMAEYFTELSEEIKSHDWCDLWGDLYMSLITSGDGKGQFFTPSNICEMMAEMTIDAESVKDKGVHTKFGERVTINDCACGSGRCLLAGASRVAKFTERKPYIVGEDLDAMCCKMTAINIAVHGWFGEVVCHDTLTEPNDMRMGYIINETMYPFPTNVPSIRKCGEPNTFLTCRIWNQKKAIAEKEKAESKPKAEAKKPSVSKEKKTPKYTQLSLF